jgi:hypothetical protein
MAQLWLKMFSKCSCRSDQIMFQIMFQIMTGDYWQPVQTGQSRDIGLTIIESVCPTY